MGLNADIIIVIAHSKTVFCLMNVEVYISLFTYIFKKLTNVGWGSFCKWDILHVLIIYCLFLNCLIVGCIFYSYNWSEKCRCGMFFPRHMMYRVSQNRRDFCIWLLLLLLTGYIVSLMEFNHSVFMFLNFNSFY